MADSIWGTGRRLDESLFKKAHEFEFFQAVRLLALMEKERVSAGSPAKASDPVRFAVQTSMAFPSSAVLEIEAGTRGLPPKMTVTFLGLIGPLGVLPDSYTESAIHQMAFGDSSFRAFFDIFHHRLVSLFYRAWEKNHFVIGYEKANKELSQRDALTAYLMDLIGMGTAGLQDRSAFPDRALLRYAGLLSQRPRSAECLRAMLHDYLGIPITVEQFLGRWHPLEPEELCELGSDDPNCQLGEGAVAGEMVWSRQGMMRIVFGPLTAKEFFDYLPDGPAFREISELVRWFIGPVVDFEMQPLLASGEIPNWCGLGDRSAGGSRLGWCSWLTEEPFEFTAKDAIFAESECICKEV